MSSSVNTRSNCGFGALPPGPFSPSRPVSDSGKDGFERMLKSAGVRLMPYPFDSAMAVASDIDGSSRETFNGYTRMLVHQLGLDFGDSAWLHWRYNFNRNGKISATNSVGFLSPSLTEHTADAAKYFIRNFTFHELLAEYHEGTIDHLHALLPHGPRAAVLTKLFRDGNSLVADMPPLDVSCSDIHLFGICFVSSGEQDPAIQSVRVECAGGETADYTLADHDGPADGNGYSLYIRDVGSEGSEGVPHLRNVARIVATTANGGSVIPDRAILLGTYGPILLDRLNHLREKFNVELPLVTEHAKMHFRNPISTEFVRQANLEKLQSQSDSLFGFTGPLTDSRGTTIVSMDSDEPHSPARVLPEMVEQAELRFIVPAPASSNVGYHATDLLAASPTRSGGGFYWAKRTMPNAIDPEPGTMFDGKTRHDTFVARVQRAVDVATAQPGSFWPIYTHIGSLARVDGRRIDLPTPYFEPGPLLLLQDRHFGITSAVPENGRIWFARASTLYDYVLMLQTVPDHMERSGSGTIRISSWQDPVLGKRLPRTPSQLYGLTFYVDDENAAEVSLDGTTIEHVTRNPPDSSGCASITIAECDIATTLFRGVDPAARAGAVVEGGRWDWRRGDAPCGRLASARPGDVSTLKVPMHGTALPGAQLLSLRLRINAGCGCGLLLETRSGGRFWFGTAELGDRLGTITASYGIDRLLQADRWIRLVVPFHDLDWSAGAVPGGPLPGDPLESLTLVSTGAREASVEFGDVRLLRPRASTQAHRFGPGHCVVGLIPGAGAGETVRLDPPQRHGTGRTTQTDQLGWFSFTRVKPGVYDIIGSNGGVDYRSARGAAVEVWSDIARLELSDAVAAPAR